MELLKLIPPSVYQAVGTIVVLFLILFKEQIGRLLWKMWNRDDGSGDERIHERRKEFWWLEKFLDMSQKQMAATADASANFTSAVMVSADKTGDAIRVLTETIANLAMSVNAHERKAESRHGETQERLASIEKHRRRD